MPFLVAEPRECQVWRISVTPSSGPAVAADIAARASAEFYYDWGGGLIWAAIAGSHGCGRQCGAHRDRHAWRRPWNTAARAGEHPRGGARLRAVACDLWPPCARE